MSGDTSLSQHAVSAGSAPAANVDSLADEIAALAAHLDVATHRLLTCLRALDAQNGWVGFASCAHWLSWRTGLDPGAAREKVRVARALGELPRMDEALERGTVSYSKVRAMTRVAGAEDEMRWLELAEVCSAAQIERLARRVRAARAAQRDEATPPERFCHFVETESGMVRMVAQLDPVEAAAVQAALESARAELRSRVSAETSGGAAHPSVADALVAVVESFVAHGASARTSGERHEVVIHVRRDELVGVSAEAGGEAPWCGALEDGRRVSAETLRRVCCDAGLVPVATDEQGSALDVGRRSRTIPAPMARALRARDGCCRFPGCEHRVFVEGHHVQHWAHGGSTSLMNLVLLCWRHHRLVHEGGFTVEADARGGLAFADPRGRVVPVVPARPPYDSRALALARAAPPESAPLPVPGRLDYDMAAAAVM